MLDALKFVKGAVSKKDLVPELTHFLISEGRVTGYNGKLSLSAPIPLDIDCCPRAEPFIKAVETCKDTAQLSLTASNRLSIRSGRFRALIDTIVPDAFPVVLPEGTEVNLEGIPLLPVFEVLEPIIGTDASRPWANGVLLDGESAFVTNNVILAEYFMGCYFPYRVTIPRYAVRELLRIGEAPIRVQLSALSATFHFEGDRWMRTQLVSHEWPNVRGMLNEFASAKQGFEVGENFWEAVDTLAPFTNDIGAVIMEGASLRTHAEIDAQGAAVDLEGWDPSTTGMYNHKLLSLLQPVATHINFAAYPGKVDWYGSSVRGLLMGMRLNPIGAPQ